MRQQSLAPCCASYRRVDSLTTAPRSFYSARGSGFGDLATKYAIAGGESVVRRWHHKWDGTVNSLRRKVGSGRRPMLTAAQQRRLIVDPVRRANQARRAIHYDRIRSGVISATRKPISIQTIRRIGHKAKIKQKVTRKQTEKECQSHAHSTFAMLFYCS
jgi:transposase